MWLQVALGPFACAAGRAAGAAAPVAVNETSDDSQVARNKFEGGGQSFELCTCVKLYWAERESCHTKQFNWSMSRNTHAKSMSCQS